MIVDDEKVIVSFSLPEVFLSLIVVLRRWVRQI
jgi:hypothetical protein